MKKKCVIIGAGEFQLPLIEKANELDYETHVFAWEKGAVGKDISDYFYPISITNKKEILDECIIINPHCVVSIGSDLAALTVNFVSRYLGLSSNPEKVDNKATNKFSMRKAFKECGINTPSFYILKEENDVKSSWEKKNLQFPVVVKPTDRSGSRGVRKVHSVFELENAVELAIQYSFEKTAIIEEFIRGKEYSAEIISYQGKHHILAFTEKFTTGAPDYIEVAHIEPSGLSKDNTSTLEPELKRALDALDIKTGASHCEFKINNQNEIWIIEIGARMGGDCIGSDLVKLSSGNDYVNMVIDAAAGIQPEINENINHSAMVRFIFSENDLLLLDKIKQDNPEIIDKIFLKNNINSYTSNAIVDSSSRLGYFILKSKGRSELERYLPRKLV